MHDPTSKGWETYYLHLSKFNVQEGSKVTAGQKIGEVGKTGRAKGPHLHFEIHRNGAALDPRSTWMF